jgi:hypothetical protein
MAVLDFLSNGSGYVANSSDKRNPEHSGKIFRRHQKIVPAFVENPSGAFPRDDFFDTESLCFTLKHISCGQPGAVKF